MMSHYFKNICLCSTVLILTACSTVYIEQETPPGQVEPVPARPVSSSARTTSLLDGAAIERERAPRGGFHQAKVNQRDSLGAFLSRQSSVGFENAYRKNGFPKIAIFNNRELSQNILDWQEGHRVVLAGKDKKQGDRSLVIAGGSTRFGDKGSRFSTSSNWKWRFENRLTEGFLSSGVKLVDRATIMRLVAADVDDAKDSSGLLSVKKIEMDALKGYADIFIEILAMPSGRSELKYELRASAKKVKTGEILAMVTTLGHSFAPLESQESDTGNSYDRIVPEGYVKKTKHHHENAEQVADWMLAEIQRGLVMAWSH